MKFNAIISLLACTASATAAAINSASSSDDAVPVLFRRETLLCNESNVPGNLDDCDRLFQDIQWGVVHANLQTGSPRTLRYNSCFVSWSNNVVGNAGDLLEYMDRMRTTCLRSQSKSGIIKGVHLHGGISAIAICLSSRGTGCSNA
ncbi:hypothetical protein QBC37DRAFT_288442 [Rhypophila decipiens]|uniref:WD-like domain-containing protein n=1 Tax=Rhypophila decipiens TaxID=261697 RepID=A0AAN7B6W1_9PEZI|nr:hypothetical protein QBC37DRAFT_288442 [Rhypophila decipiens]